MKIAIVGYYGKVGKSVIKAVNEDSDCEIAFGVSRSAKENDTKDGIRVFKNFEVVDMKCEGIIDFSHRDNIASMLDYAVKNNVPVVIGTTGLNEDDEKKVEEASKNIPILLSHNTGFGINIMLGILKKMAKELKEFDIEIIEKHHNRKEDAPSGTAKMLFDSMKEARPELYPQYGRDPVLQKRKKEEVGFHSVRGGNIISDHDVIFAGEDDVLTLSHQALTDASFAKGALRGIKYLKNQKNGLFSMEDVIKG